jgi:hypothetical protein
MKVSLSLPNNNLLSLFEFGWQGVPVPPSDYTFRGGGHQVGFQLYDIFFYQLHQLDGNYLWSVVAQL